MSRASLALLLVLMFTAALLMNLASSAPSPSPPESLVCTFSIVAYDPDKQEWGVAVASKYLAVGAVVPWPKAGVGAVATQSYVNVSYRPHGLELLATGKSAEETIKALTDGDEQKATRQLGIVDAKGNPANFSGSKCLAW